MSGWMRSLIGRLPLRRVSRLDAGRLARDLKVDRALGLLLLAVIVVLMAVAAGTGGAGLWGATAVGVAFAVWMSLGLLRARSAADLQGLAHLEEMTPADADQVLAAAMQRRPLPRQVRLMLYFRLGALRYAQRRYGEAGAVCHVLLAQPLGRVEGIRPALLLMLGESRLRYGDMPGVYAVLQQLYALRLSLGEALQRLALQTRYEVAVGQDAAALADLRRKVQASELLAPEQCGQLHAVWAWAARRQGHGELAAWLQERAELLGARIPAAEGMASAGS